MSQQSPTAGVEQYEQRSLLLVTALLLGAAAAALAVTAVETGATELLPAGTIFVMWSALVVLVAAELHAAVTGRNASSFSELEVVVAVGGGLAGLLSLLVVASPPLTAAPTPLVAIAPSLALILCWLLGRHFSRVSAEELPEAPALVRWTRLAAWFVLLGSFSAGARFVDPTAPWARPAQLILGLFSVGVAAAILFAREAPPATPPHRNALPGLDIGLLDVVARRNNPVASAFDALECFLGVDLRGSWAIRVVRRGAEPLFIGVLALAWAATSLTLVKVDEQALIERSGRVLSQEPLGPGLHLHLPWPFDRVLHFPVARVQSVALGHEAGAGEGPAGPYLPENVLWARQHEAVEYTLLLGNGHELVAVDGTLSFRVRDLSAWLYGSADSAAVVRALLYASVTRHTADRSLDQVLSENLAVFTHDIRDEVQAEANRLRLGIDVVAMTVGGMHPPVAVAEQYEAVVSAQVERDTRILNAKTDAERAVPAAEASADSAISSAQAKAGEKIANALGDAETFRSVRTSFHEEQGLFEYRRRLEALETGLAGRPLVIIDDRLERDGAELWLKQ